MQAGCDIQDDVKSKWWWWLEEWRGPSYPLLMWGTEGGLHLIPSYLGMSTKYSDAFTTSSNGHWPVIVICYLYLIKCTWWAKANDSVDLSIRLNLLSGGHTEFSLFKQKLRCSRCLLFPHRHTNTISFWQKISMDIGDWFPLDLGSSPSPEMRHYLSRWYDCMRNGCLQLTCWLRQDLSTWWCTTIYPADSHVLDA